MREVKRELEKIEAFAKHYSKVDNVAGFNMLASKRPGVSYIEVKEHGKREPLAFITIFMDCVSVLDRPLMANAINRGINQGQDLTPEQLENEMICKAD